MESHSTPGSRHRLVKLPHPFLTSYQVQTITGDGPDRLMLALHEQPQTGDAPDQPLHHNSLSWLDLSCRSQEECPPLSDNSDWARGFRSPQTTFQWTGSRAPSLGQIWNVIHAIFLTHPTCEHFRLTLLGHEERIIRNELLSTGLGVEHPVPWHFKGQKTARSEELLILRSAFWQGAGSPLGPRPIWAIGDGTDGTLRGSLAQYPIMAENYQMSMKFPLEAVYARHPIRRPKPHPGSIVYSRYIPELNEHFSLEVVNWQDQGHLELFNAWQNDPRVAKGWNETGTLDEHRQYLRRLHFDSHVLCLFGRFDESRFAYFELYWAKVKYQHNLSNSIRDTHVFSAGRSLRCPLQCWKLRSWSPFPCW